MSEAKNAKKGYEQHYISDVVPALKKEFQYKGSMQVPKLEKIVINSCLKEATQDKKVVDKIAEEISAIAGQKPILTRAKKAISNFKLREGQPLGCKVTLRGYRMYEFLNRLVNVALPRVRDFRGVSRKGFDGKGNCTLGLTEQVIFPEVNLDKVERTTGMSVTFVTSAKTDNEARQLLKLMGMPFKE